MSYQILIDSVKILLCDTGRFTLIIPFSDHADFIESAKSQSLYCNKKAIVFPKASKEPSRTLLEFSKSPSEVFSEELVIRNENNSYSKEYRALTSVYHFELK